MGDFSSEIISQVDRGWISKLLDNGKRVDGRKFDEYRPIEIELDPIAEKAEGSAIVRMGETTVIAGVKMILGEPYSDKPADGVTMVTAEMTPIASPMFEPGPPREDAIELARVVDRGVRESETVDTSALCIEPGKKVFLVFCDVYPLEYDGNLFDASSLAVNAALKRTEYEDYTWEDGKAVATGEKKKLPLNNMALELTVANIGPHMVIDPVLKEEFVMDSRLTMAIDKNNHFAAIQKGGGIGPITLDQIDRAMGMALDRVEDLRDVLNATLEEVE
ncbi:MAG: exosome complex protein Rrp42 [Promethearchaeia archaeon]